MVEAVHINLYWHFSWYLANTSTPKRYLHPYCLVSTSDLNLLLNIHTGKSHHITCSLTDFRVGRWVYLRGSHHPLMWHHLIFWSRPFFLSRPQDTCSHVYGDQTHVNSYIMPKNPFPTLAKSFWCLKLNTAFLWETYSIFYFKLTFAE